MNEEYRLRYASEGLAGDPKDPNFKPLFVAWNNVINQVECKTDRTVGRAMELLEALGLSDKQEKAVKNTLKRIIYSHGNDMLDWMTFQLMRPVAGVEGMEALPDRETIVSLKGPQE